MGEGIECGFWIAAFGMCSSSTPAFGIWRWHPWGSTATISEYYRNDIGLVGLDETSGYFHPSQNKK